MPPGLRCNLRVGTKKKLFSGSVHTSTRFALMHPSVLIELPQYMWAFSECARVAMYTEAIVRVTWKKNNSQKYHTTSDITHVNTFPPWCFSGFHVLPREKSVSPFIRAQTVYKPLFNTNKSSKRKQQSFKTMSTTWRNKKRRKTHTTKSTRECNITLLPWL